MERNQLNLLLAYINTNNLRQWKFTMTKSTVSCGYIQVSQMLRVKRIINYKMLERVI